MTVVDDIIRREGSTYSDRGADRGGPTKFGVTLEALRAWRNVEVTAADVEAMKEDEAREIYMAVYIARPRFCDIADEALRNLVIDSGVNSGTGTAAKWLQGAAGGIKVDGSVGTKTLALVNALPPRALYYRVLAARLRFEGALITRHSDQAANAAGWANRLAEFVEN